jgi:hypothetical protein
MNLKPNEDGTYLRVINVSIMNGVEQPFVIKNLHLVSKVINSLMFVD